MKAVLLVGGKGTRLYPYTASFPKPLMPIGDRPILEILVRQLKHYGFTDFTFCVGHLAPLIKTFFKNGRWLGIKINYSFEKKPLGTVGPLTLISEDLPDNFLVANGDLLTSADFREMMKQHKNKKALLTIGTYKLKQKIDSGTLKLNNGKITSYIEKPELEFFISAGFYIFNKKILDFIPKNEYFDIPNLVKILLKKKKKINSYLIDGLWLDIGRPDDYQKAIEIYSDNKNLLKK